MKTTIDLQQERDLSDCLADIMPFLVNSADTGDVQHGANGVDALESFRILIGWDKEKYGRMCDFFRINDE